MPFNKDKLLSIANQADRDTLLYFTSIHLDMIEMFVDSISLIHKVGDEASKELARESALKHKQLTEKFNLIPVTGKDLSRDSVKH